MTKPYPVSVQLYSLRSEAEKDFPAVLKKLSAFGYAGVEFAGFHKHGPKELRSILDDLNLKTPSIHGAFPTQENLKEIVETAHVLGYRWHVTGYGPDRFTSLDGCMKAAQEFQSAAEMLKKEGLTFGMHNHWWEFDHKFNGKTPHQILMENAPDLVAEIDTYWVKVGGEDPAGVIRDLKGRTPLLHIKDGPLDRNKAMTAVGQGKMDWKSVLAAADESVKWLVVELDRCDTDMTKAVEDSLAYLVKNGYGRVKAH